MERGASSFSKSLRSGNGHGARFARPMTTSGSLLEDLSINRSEFVSYRKAFDRKIIPDTLERVVNKHVAVKASGAAIVYRLLESYSVPYVFSYSGGASLPLLNEFYKQDTTAADNVYNESQERRSNVRDRGPQMIGVMNEATAGHMAQAFGRLTGLPGVVIVTSGPGLTNLLTPIQDAYMDGDPMLVISGQVATTVMGTDAFQECPATAMTQPCTKWNFLVKDVQMLPWALETALKVAMSGRKGPVHIDIPKDVMVGMGMVPHSFAPMSGYQQEPHAYVEAFKSNRRLDVNITEETITRITELLCHVSERPLIIAGHGVVDSYDLLRNLVNKLNIPVATTLHALGALDERHPLSLHMVGMHGSVYANKAVQNADLIFNLGSRFDDRTTGNPAAYAPKAREAGLNGTGGIIHIDIDARQLGKIIDPDVHVNSDCKTLLETLLPRIKTPTVDRSSWVKQCLEWKANHPFHFVPTANPFKVKTQEVVHALYEASETPEFKKLQKRLIVCTGVGNHQMMTAQHFRWKRPNSLVCSGGLGTMGVGLPYALACQLAHPDSVVLLIDGDGSFNMSCVELGTLRQLGLPIKIAIMNDGVQQMVRAWQHLFFEDRYVITTNSNPSYTKLAEAFEIPAIQCNSAAALRQVASQLLLCEGPMLVDFKCEPDICLPLVPPGKSLDEMILPGQWLASDELQGCAAPS